MYDCHYDIKHDKFHFFMKHFFFMGACIYSPNFDLCISQLQPLFCPETDNDLFSSSVWTNTKINGQQSLKTLKVKYTEAHTNTQ